MIAVLLALFTAFAADCPRQVPISEFETTLQRAESAFSELDDVGFRDAVNVLAGLQLPCLSASIPKNVAARHHRVMSLHLFSIGDEESAMRAVEAARLNDPEFSWPDALLPSDHPLRQHYESAEVTDKARKVPEPRSGSLGFDGTNSRKRPKFQPTVAQIFDQSGQPQSTTYLGARDPLPAYRAIPRQRTTLMIGSGSAVVISGVLYGLAHASRGNLFSSARDQSVSAKTLDAKRDRTNGLTLASGAFLGLGIGAGVGAALIGER